MAKLSFDIMGNNVDYVKKVERLQAAIQTTALAADQKVNSSTQRFFSNVGRTAEMIGGDLKQKIDDEILSMNELTKKIIHQQTVVRELQETVHDLSEEYDKLSEDKTGFEDVHDMLNTTKSALIEQKNVLSELMQEQANVYMSMEMLNKQFLKSEVSSDKVTSMYEKMGVSMKKLVLSTIGNDDVENFISNIITVASSFQEIEIALTEALGSYSKAKEIMDSITEFGVNSSFPIDELLTSYIKMANQGFEPTIEQMQKLGALANFTNHTFSQIAEALIDAQAGENERLKNLGISVSENVDTLTFIFRNQETTINNTASAIREYILSLGGLEEIVRANESASSSFAKKLSTIGNVLIDQFRNIGERFNSEITAGMGAVEFFTKNLNNMIPVIGGLVAIYGTYKTAILAVNAAHKAGALYENMRLIVMYRKELGLVTAAQQAFNTASKANIYAGLLSVLAGLGTAVYMFTRRIDESANAQERFSKVSLELRTEISKEINIVQELFEKLSTAKKGTQEFADAKDAILDKYGDYISNMNLELDTIDKQTSAYDELTNAIRRNVSEKLKEKFINEGVGEASGKQAEALKMIRESLIMKNTSFSDALKGEYNPTIESEAQFNAVKELLSKNDFAGAGKLLFKEYGMNFMAGSGKGLEQYKNAALEIKQVFKDADDLFTLRDIENFSEPNITEEINNLTQNIATLKQDIADLRSGKLKPSNGKKVETEIKEKTDKLQLSEKSLEILKGEKSKFERPDQLDELQDRLKNLLAKQANEQIQITEDLWMQVWQMQIDSMNEGSEKTLAQMEFNHEKELIAIDREKEDLLQKKRESARAVFNAKEDINVAENPGYVRQIYDPSETTLSDIEQERFDEKYKAILKKQINERDAYYASEKRSMDEYLAAYGDYVNKRQAIIDIAESKKIGKSEGEKKKIDVETAEKVFDLDIVADKETAAFGRLFSDMKGRAIKDLHTIADEAQKALDFVKKGVWNDKVGESFGISKEVFDNMQNLSSESGGFEKIQNTIDNLNSQADASETAFNKMGNGFKKAFAAGADTKSVQEGLAEIEQGLNGVMQAAQFLSNSLAGIGDAFGNDTMTGIAEGIGVAMDAVGGAMEGAKAGAAFGPWGAAAGAAIGLVSSLSSSLAKMHDAKNEKRIQVMQEQVETLEKAYGNLGEAVEKAYSADASELISQQNEMLEQQKVLIQNQIIEEKNKKKSDDGRIKEWEEQLEAIDKQIGQNKDKQIDAIMGSDLKSAIDDFAQAYADAWSAGNDRAKSSKDLVKDMIKQMIMESLKAASSEPMEKLRKKLAEFYKDGIISAWEREQIEKDAEAITKDLDSKYGWADEYLQGEEEGTSQADASKGGFETMSQETGEELNGRFTALQVSNEEIRNSMTAVLGNLSSLCTTASDGNVLLSEMRNLAVMSNGHLEDIAKHTKVLLGFGEKLDRIEQNTGRI